MMVRWRCKACGFETMLLPEFRGQKVRCPKCGAVGEVPGDVVEREGKLRSVERRFQKQRPQRTADAKMQPQASKKGLVMAILILCAGAAVALLLWLAL